MKLFKPSEISKFFDILYKLGRATCLRYKGYDKLNPHMSPCEKEVFIKRTVHKWLKNKYLVLYKTSEQTEIEYKQYISILNIRFSLDYSQGNLIVRYMDYSKPFDLWTEIKLSYNDILALEGEWSDNFENHKALLRLTMLNIEPKEYKFKCYNWHLYPKRKPKGKTDEEIIESLSSTISFWAKTEKEAYKLKNNYQQKEGENIIIYDLIEG